MLTVIARFEIKPEQVSTFREVMRELGAAVRKNEPDCALYQLCSAKDPNTFVVVERYKDKDAFKAHASSEHFQAASKRLPECVAAAPQIELLEEVD